MCTLTDGGCDAIVKGCKDGQPGHTTIIRDGRQFLVCTQLVGSPRTYVDTTGMNSDENKEEDKSIGVDVNWHYRLAHVSEIVVKKTLEMYGEGQKYTEHHSENPCHACVIAKMRKLPAPSVSQNRAKNPLEMICLDLSGGVKNRSLGGAKYFGVVTDEATGYVHCVEMSAKSDFGKHVIEWLTFAEKWLQRKVKKVRMDNAGEHQPITEWCREHGIEVETTVAGNSFQNGLAERVIGVMRQMVRTVMAHCKAPAGMWAEALHYCEFVYNHTAHQRLGWKAPIVLFKGDKVRLDMLHPFGCRVYVRTNPTDKFQPRAQACVYVGPADRQGKKGHRVWSTTEHKVLLALHVRFVENEFPWTSSGVINHDEPDDEDEGAEEKHVVNSDQPKNSAAGHRAPDESSSSAVTDDVVNSPTSADQDAKAEHASASSSSTESKVDTNSNQPQRSSTRSNRGIPAGKLGEWFAIDAMRTNAENECDDDLPQTHAEAMRSERADEWSKAEETELKSLRDFNTYVTVETLPDGKRALRGKWVYAIKKNERGEVVGYKARYVACGYTQIPFVDFLSTKADVAETRSFRLVLSVAAARKMVLGQADVSSAFLNGKLNEEIYVYAPEGCSDRLWRLMKPLYGLKQAGHEWRIELDNALISLGFCATRGDPGLYYLWKDTGLSLLATHVDDMLIAADDGLLRDHVFGGLNEKYKMKIIYNPSWLLHMRIRRVNDSLIMLDQEGYIDDCVKAFEIEGAGVSTPIIPGMYLTDGKERLNANDAKKYMQMTGSLSYLATHTRPDLSFVAGQLGKFMHSPCTVHMDVVVRAWRYAMSTKDSALIFRGCGDRKAPLFLCGFSDADFANETDRHCIGGVVFTLIQGTNRSIVSWSSRKFNHVCLSTEEAELCAASEATREAIALHKILQDVRLVAVSESPLLCMDNRPSVRVARNIGYYSRLKHVDVRHKFVAEAHRDGKICVTWIKGEDNLSDAMTKPVTRSLLRKFSKEVFGTSI